MEPDVKKGKVEFMALDLSSFASVREFVKNFKAKNLPSRDILINNAGVMWCPYTETEDGFEMVTSHHTTTLPYTTLPGSTDICIQSNLGSITWVISC